MDLVAVANHRANPVVVAVARAVGGALAAGLAAPGDQHALAQHRGPRRPVDGPLAPLHFGPGVLQLLAKLRGAASGALVFERPTAAAAAAAAATTAAFRCWPINFDFGKRGSSRQK